MRLAGNTALAYDAWLEGTGLNEYKCSTAGDRMLQVTKELRCI